MYRLFFMPFFGGRLADMVDIADYLSMIVFRWLIHERYCLLPDIICFPGRARPEDTVGQALPSLQVVETASYFMSVSVI